MRVRLTRSAEADLEKIGDQIAVNDPERARVTMRALRAAARSIGGSPYSGSPVLAAPGTRKKSVPPYLALYRVAGGEVVILRVVHQRSDWASLA